MRRIIGISGKAESGKDVACGFITAVFPNARRTAFADELKLRALKAWPHTEFHPYQPYLNLLTRERQLRIAEDLKANAAFRSFLQETGERMRAEDPNYWIDLAFKHHGTAHGWDRIMVIPDVRHRNEAQAILDSRGLLLRVERPGHENRLTEVQRLHPSEIDLDEFPWDSTPGAGRVLNDGTPVGFLSAIMGPVRGYLDYWTRGGGV